MSQIIQNLFPETNISVASLPATLLLSALPHWYSIYLAQSNRVEGGWKNQNPRAFVARLNAKAGSGKKLTDLEETILRGQSAQQNGFEWWPVWAAAVAFGYLSNVSVDDMNQYTLIHLSMRMLYNYLYVTTKTRRGSYLRTIVFQVSLYPAPTLYFGSIL
ncbi:unnamed protein product [Clonostachys byssicola]|uniref:Uncharacterized protein n=1 Tax=Clonostachys byssicola TaxID=160290 RepID=A0A9N9UL29_9HYPO|nr:unnamed protein product [Clonostachys byssicola]